MNETRDFSFRAFVETRKFIAAMCLARVSLYFIVFNNECMIGGVVKKCFYVVLWNNTQFTKWEIWQILP